MTGDAEALARAAADELKVNPSDPIVIGHALDAAEAREFWTEAAGLAARVAAIDPNTRRHEARLRRAHALERAGQLSAALSVYSEADDPATIKTQTRLAVATGQFETAAHLFDQWPQDGFEPAELRERAYVLRRAGQSAKALSLYGAALATGRLDDHGRADYAWLLNEKARYTEAYAVASPLPIRDGRTLELRSHTAAWAGKHDEAATLLSQWVTHAPGDVAGWLLLAEAQHQRGDRAAQAQALEMAARLDPGTAAAVQSVA
jgi:tetratricopeptide (TPR) repeat protein